MNKILSILTTVLLSTNSAFAKSSEIMEWKDVIPQKGYILSVDLAKDKECSQIWTKQIKEFLKMNPHIKNADLILVNQKIKVQSCKMKIEQSQAHDMEKHYESIPKPELPSWFIGAFIGMNHLAEKNGDTSKKGKSMGLKLGKIKEINNKLLSISLGALANSSQTIDDNDPLGVYEIKSVFATLETSLHFAISDRVYLGPQIMLMGGRDVSLSDKDKGHNVGAYIGASSLVDLSKYVRLELNLQQRLDEMSRLNLLGNIGLRLDF